jgi:hypothetical protein
MFSGGSVMPIIARIKMQMKTVVILRRRHGTSDDVSP